MSLTTFSRGSLIAVLSTGVMFAQGQTAPTPSPGATTGGNPTVGGARTNTPTLPGNTNPTNPTQSPFPDMQRPIFLSGKVVTDDGTPPPESVMIERVCGSRIIQEGYTDSKGRFQFELGRNRMMLADASTDNPFGDGIPGMANSRGTSANSMGNTGNMMGERSLMGCELRANLPGFRSDNVNLSTHRSMDNPDVGTLVLRRLANVEGLTISMTSYAAPKDAKKAFEKARDLAKKNKLDDALTQFQKAVELYPKYAVAWFELGRIQEAQNHPEEARKSYEECLKADSKLISPYGRMALMAARDQKWQETADISDRMIRLNPVDFPEAYFYNAVANLNLQKLDAAERSAGELLKIDNRRKFVRAEHVMAIVLAQKQDLEGSAQHLKAFLQLVPAGPDAENAKKQLAEIEKTIQAKKE